MHRFARACALMIASALVTVGLAAPASAGPYDVSVTSGPGVIFEGCSEHAFNYSVTPPEATDQWSINLSVQRPDGSDGGSMLVVSPAPTTGVLVDEVCSESSMPGTYTVTGVYKVLENVPGQIAYKTTLTPVTPFTFDMRAHYAAVTAKPSDKTPRLGQRVKVRVAVTDERPSGGFFPTDSAPVVLQRLKGSKWVGVRGTKEYTVAAGKAVLRFRHAWRGKTKFRARANVGFIGKVDSSTFTLRARR